MRGLKDFDPERFRGRYRKGGFSARAPKTTREARVLPRQGFPLKSRSKPAYRLNIIAVYEL
jgi:hypothetical protein